MVSLPWPALPTDTLAGSLRCLMLQHHAVGNRFNSNGSLGSQQFACTHECIPSVLMSMLYAHVSYVTCHVTLCALRGVRCALCVVRCAVCSVRCVLVLMLTLMLMVGLQAKAEQVCNISWDAFARCASQSFVGRR